MAAIALSGCAKTKPLDPALITAASLTDALPAPQAGDVMGAQREYRIGPLDKLRIQVFGVQELDREGQVDVTGSITMPLVGSVKASGETPNGFAQRLEALYGERYLRDPQISVLVVDAISQQVTVDGAVEKPGQYPVIGNASLMTAVASAGGTSDLAKLDSVMVFRSINDKRMVARFSLAAIRGGTAEDPAIYGNDVIVVGSGTGRFTLRDLFLLTPLFGTFYTLTR
jgi:polysaccharide biosynthesis/export protein